jgi:hypothetical protein
MSIEQRDHRGRFAPGHRPHPRGGRPKGFAGMARQIAEETGDGAELVAFALGVLRDEDASPDRRFEALRWLSDRGWGKPAAIVDVSVSTPASLPPDWSALTPAERMAWLDRVAPPLLGSGDS